MGEEDWAPEHDVEEPSTLDEEQIIWRIVDKNGKTYKSGYSTAFNKPYYGTLRGAKSALGQLRRDYGEWFLEEGTVTWRKFSGS